MRTYVFRRNAFIGTTLLALVSVVICGAPTLYAGSDVLAKATGSLTVQIKPKEVRKEGARWRVDNGPWQKGGRTVSDLSEGQHSITFKNVSGWTKPNGKIAVVIANEETSLRGKYVRTPGSIQTVMLPGDIPLEVVWIPKGSFLMGRYTDEPNSATNESPQHQVKFASGFWMGKYELTKAQWWALMNTTPWYEQIFVLETPNSPAVYVSWDDAQAFIAALNKHVADTDQGDATFRLPTEAQWEYACRAGTTTRYYWGDDLDLTEILDNAWVRGNAYEEDEPYAHIVGQKLPNAWGLYDMSGNAREWCEDWYHSTYEGAPTDGSAWVLPTHSDRIVRGGDWFSHYTLERSAARVGFPPSTGQRNYIGIRLVKLD